MFCLFFITKIILDPAESILWVVGHKTLVMEKNNGGSQAGGNHVS